MKTRVLSIDKVESDSSLVNQNIEILNVIVLLDSKQHKFRFIAQKDRIKSQEITTFCEDANFSQMFRFNTHIALEITDLVAKVYQNEILEFPIDLPDFETSEQVLAQQKPFDTELVR